MNYSWNDAYLWPIFLMEGENANVDTECMTHAVQAGFNQCVIHVINVEWFGTEWFIHSVYDWFSDYRLSQYKYTV